MVTESTRDMFSIPNTQASGSPACNYIHGLPHPACRQCPCLPIAAVHTATHHRVLLISLLEKISAPDLHLQSHFG
jgi:hypothetical protein